MHSELTFIVTCTAFYGVLQVIISTKNSQFCNKKYSKSESSMVTIQCSIRMLYERIKNNQLSSYKQDTKLNCNCLLVKRSTFACRLLNRKYFV